MKIVIATDTMKGSLSSLEAGEAIRKGIARIAPEAQILVRPLADGGEGTVEALVPGMNGILQSITVTGPLGKPVRCEYGILPATGTAILEMSSAAGITLLDKTERNPLDTTTYGVGEIIRDAIGKKCRHFIIGIGGSATNDGGIGMLQALGFGMLDRNGNQVPRGARGLAAIDHITDDKALSELSACEFRIACDVTNPLCGSQGCSQIFGPQKGADSEMIRKMDQWLSHYAMLCHARYPFSDQDAPGSGAAGGLGFAFRTFLHADLTSGVRLILEETHLEDYLADADLVITGEGRLDAQSAMGKAPIGVAGLAKKYGIPVIALAGCVTENATICNQYGIDAFFPILHQPVTLEEAMEPEAARKNLTLTAEQVFRLISHYSS